MALITCNDVSLGYDGRIVTENINFNLNTGDYLCIVGENGAGKSTLMKAILHLKAPTLGEIRTGDGLKPYEIGYLPQQTMIQKDFPASVEEIVLSGALSKCGLRPFYNRSEKQMAKDNMHKLGILELRKSCYRELSGGQQQRVLLARALCATTKLLLLDEPVAGLDPKVTGEFYELIHKLNQEGITIIMISHDIKAAVTYASHILHLGKSQLFFGKKEEYMVSTSGLLFQNTSKLGGDEYESST